METLNVGCGGDSWGSVRVDISRKWGARPSTLTVLADACQLPFRDRAFGEARCWHMLEHLNDPLKAYSEILRVSRSSDVRFPTEHFLQRASQSMDISRIKTARKIIKSESSDSLHRYSHLWTIHPKALDAKNYYQVRVEPSFVTFFRCGRKARFFRWIPPIRIVPYEWVVQSRAS